MGLGGEDGVEGGPVHGGQQGVPDVPGQVEHAAHGRGVQGAVGVQPGGQGRAVGHVQRRVDGVGAQCLQFLDEPGAPSGRGVRVEAVPGGAVGQRRTADQDEVAGAASDQEPAQQPAEGAEGTGDQVGAVGAQPGGQGAGEAFGTGEAG